MRLLENSGIRVFALITAALASVCTGTAQTRFEYGIEAAADRAADGAQRVPPDHIFRSGDRFRVAFKSSFDAFVYLYSRGESESAYTRLFPHDQIEASNLVRPGYEVRVPDGGGWMALDDRPGTERLMMVVANRPQRDLEEAGAEVERDRLDRLILQMQQIPSVAAKTRHQKDGWTRLNFQGKEPARIFFVGRMILTHHIR